MKYDLKELIGRWDAGERPAILPFFGGTGRPGAIDEACLSQWYDCRFAVDGVAYHTTEQYMMAQKAVLMGDGETLARIMAADNPRDYKALGRRVKPFDAALWDRSRFAVVVRGNMAKFSGNPALWAFLDGTGDSVLVEASPYDDIWGVRVGAQDPRIRDPRQWDGQNLLGFALMEVRDALRQGPAAL